MIIFRNPGVIDLAAAVTLGVSVKNPGSFGRFGTGVKFAVATVLRGGGSVVLYAGNKRHEFGKKTRKIRGEDFEIVTLGRKELGFTTQLGKDWEPWMVLREFGCNARDEGGSFTDNPCPEDAPGDDNTVFIVEWDALDSAYKMRSQLFLEGAPVHENRDLRILPGRSDFMFYRGVRALKLDKPSLYTYDVLAQQTLTEDRTLVGTWSIDRLIRDALITIEDKEMLRPIVAAHKEAAHEGKLDFDVDRWGVKPSKAFLDAAIETRASGKINETVRKLLGKHMRRARGDEAHSGGSTYYRVIDDAFQYAVDQLEEIGIKFDSAQKFVRVDELPEGVNSIVEDGRVYVLDKFLDEARAREIAGELIHRWMDLQDGVWDADTATKAFVPILIDLCPSFKRDEKIAKEDLEEVEEEVE